MCALRHAPSDELPYRRIQQGVAMTSHESTVNVARRSERIWKRKDLEANGFGSERIWKRKDLEANGFGSERIWKRTDLEAKGFGSERIWKRKDLEAEHGNNAYILRMRS